MKIGSLSGAVASFLELSGLCGIVYGVGLVSIPAAFIVGGSLAVLAAFALTYQPQPRQEEPPAEPAKRDDVFVVGPRPR